MNSTIIDNLRYISENFSLLESRIIAFLIVVYLLYGVLIGIDASKRYKSKSAPFVAFICWCLFSIVFIPIYLIVRPDYGSAKALSHDKQKQALLFGSGLDECPNCNEVVERFYQYCRKCGCKLLRQCNSCEKTIPNNWSHCVYCGQNQLTQATPVKMITPESDKATAQESTTEKSAVNLEEKAPLSEPGIKQAEEISS